MVEHDKIIVIKGSIPRITEIYSDSFDSCRISLGLNEHYREDSDAKLAERLLKTIVEIYAREETCDVLDPVYEAASEFWQRLGSVALLDDITDEETKPVSLELFERDFFVLILKRR